MYSEILKKIKQNKYGSVQELRSTFGNLKSLFWFGQVWFDSLNSVWLRYET